MNKNDHSQHLRVFFFFRNVCRQELSFPAAFDVLERLRFLFEEGQRWTQLLLGVGSL